jgi:sulfur-carrier protein
LEFVWNLGFGYWGFDFMIRVVLPHHLRTLAHVGDEIHVDLIGSTTVRAIIDAIEEKYPMLRGTIRDHETQKRRPLVRFFACGEDISHDPPDAPLPDPIAKGTEPFFIMGAIAGG